MTERTFATSDEKKHRGRLIERKNSEVKLKENKSKKIQALKINEESEKEFSDYIKAGKIAIEVKKYAKEIIKEGMLLLDIAKKIENKIHDLGGELAFPVNLSIDDIAAHYHPSIDDETKASGILKVDIGIHINGSVADSSFSLDLTKENKYKELIKASEEALNSAITLLKKNPDSSLNDIGLSIQSAIQKKGFSPIINLSGHSLKKYILHAGITIPNYANGSNKILESGAYAIEPFATIGEGKVYEGPQSNIYKIISFKTPRSKIAREILEYVNKKYKTLPLSLREMQEKFGSIARLAMKELEQQKICHNFPQLIEISHKPVSQAEHTIIKTSDGKILVTTQDL